jgi:hypothetical protein
MDELLKFLPIILYVLYRLFGGSKKKQPEPKPQRQKQERPKRPNTSTPSIEDILRELSGETSKKEEPKRISKPKRERKSIEIVDHSKDVRVDYNHDADTGPNLKEIRKELDEEKGLRDADDKIEFDLRQAVINDAILNRPYR